MSKYTKDELNEMFKYPALAMGYLFAVMLWVWGVPADGPQLFNYFLVTMGFLTMAAFVYSVVDGFKVLGRPKEYRRGGGVKAAIETWIAGFVPLIISLNLLGTVGII
jgi:hypothetical protein